jgi:hypothetical protein
MSETKNNKKEDI